jgi:O-antigen/teichoic acid export membrane protein
VKRLVGKLFSQSNVIFGTRIAGAGVVFLAQAAIARFWGAEALGNFLLFIATANIVAVIMPLGFETTGTFFAAEYRAAGDGRHLRGFMKRAYGHVAVMSVVFLLVGYPLAGLLGAPGHVIQDYWGAVVLMTFATALVYCNSALLIGLKRPYAGFFADTVFRPMLMILAMSVGLLGLAGASGYEAFLWVLAGGFLLIALGQFIWLWRAARTVPVDGPLRPTEVKRWWRFALPWVVIAMATDLFFDVDLMLLSNLMDRETLAVFGVCVRVFSLVSFGVAAVYSVVLPDMFSVANDRELLLRKIGDANLAAAGIALVLFVVVVFGGPLLLMLFGPAFGAGALPMAVLCATLVVRAFFGPTSVVLSMNDRPHDVLPGIALGMTVLVIANLLLVPPMGLLGAALAAVLAQTVWAAALWFTALKRTGLDVSLLPRLAEILAAHRARGA